MTPHKKLKNEYLYFRIQKWAFYFGKNACSTFPFLNVRVFCVVANRSQAFFGVCHFGCTHFFIMEEYYEKNCPFTCYCSLFNCCFMFCFVYVCRVKPTNSYATYYPIDFAWCCVCVYIFR